jgi:hypothetical protein
VTTRSVRPYERRFAGGAPCRVVEIRAAGLGAHRLLAPSRVRARDAAHLFARQGHASVEALALPPHAVRASSAPDALQCHGDDTHLSLRAAVSAWWARTPAEERSAVLGRRSGEPGRYLAEARRRGLIATHRHGVVGDVPDMVLPVGSLGHLRHVGRYLPDAVLLNSHFFLFDRVELDSPFAAIGDVAGMLATHGRIHHPPSVPRATLIHAAGRWRVLTLGADDVEVAFPDGATVRPGAPDGRTVAYRGGAPDDGAAAAGAAFEVCLQGRFATVVRAGSGLPVPHGALVVSFASRPQPEMLRALRAQPAVRYRIPRIPDLITALQAGPRLVRNGEIVVAEALRDERFGTLATRDPTAPLVFSTDHAHARAGRLGIGITRGNDLVVIAVQGASSLSDAEPDRPTGCTMTELAELLVEAGAVDAMNCDGGGSTQVFHGAGALLSSTDSRSVPGSQFDRPVPVAACLS